MSYLVGGRRQEFGVRVALGASPSSLLRLVLRRAMLLTSVGIALGALGGVAAARVLASAFEGIRPDPLVFLGAVVALSGVAFLAAWVPLARLLASGPLNALREL
jgi:ABC-type antimicrobial peptide transport system permease subunit